MVRALIFIAALTLVAAACGKDDNKPASKDDTSSAKPTGGKMATPPAIPPGSDIEPTPVDPDPAAKPSQDEPGTGGPSAVAAPSAPTTAGKKPAAGDEDDVALDDSGEPGGCVADCVQRNQMRAVGPDQIERDCKAECSDK